MQKVKLRPLFICRSVKTKYMVNLARVLKEKKWIDEGFAYVLLYREWKKYLEDSNEVHFKKIFDTDNIFQRLKTEELDLNKIKKIENKYGEYEIWNAFSQESYHHEFDYNKVFGHPRYTKDEKLHLIQLCFEQAERMLEETSFNCIIDFASVGILRSTLDMVAQANNIPYLWQTETRLADRYIIETRATPTYKNVIERYNELLENNSNCKEGHQHLDHFRGKGASSYSGFLPLASKPSNNGWRKISLRLVLKKLKRFIGTFYFIANECKIRIIAKNNPLYYYNWQLYKSLISTRFKKSIRSWFDYQRNIRLIQYCSSKDLPKDFVFITLHLQPEASTAVFAPYFVDQFAFVRNVSRSLPLHYKIVVKIHPHMIVLESYKKLKFLSQIPNVVLVFPDGGSKELIKKSKGVIAIAGTSGFEAIMLGKPVIVAGDPPYSNIHSVIKCSDPKEMGKHIRKFEDYIFQKNDVAAFLQALHDLSFSHNTKEIIWENELHDMDDDKYVKEINHIADHIIDSFTRFYN
jgi:hypothetical protein